MSITLLPLQTSYCPLERTPGGPIAKHSSSDQKTPFPCNNLKFSQFNKWATNCLKPFTAIRVLRNMLEESRRKHIEEDGRK
jgi:hypothetical protein